MMDTSSGTASSLTHTNLGVSDFWCWCPLASGTKRVAVYIVTPQPGDSAPHTVAQHCAAASQVAASSFSSA